MRDLSDALSVRLGGAVKLLTVTPGAVAAETMAATGICSAPRSCKTVCGFGRMGG